MTATTERCPGCHGSGIEMSGVTYAGMSEYVGCHECSPECPDDCGCRASDATERPESIAPRHPGATQSPDGSQGATEGLRGPEGATGPDISEAFTEHLGALAIHHRKLEHGEHILGLGITCPCLPVIALSAVPHLETAPLPDASDVRPSPTARDAVSDAEAAEWAALADAAQDVQAKHWREVLRIRRELDGIRREMNDVTEIIAEALGYRPSGLPLDGWPHLSTTGDHTPTSLAAEAAGVLAKASRLREGIEALAAEMQSDTCPACHAYYAACCIPSVLRALLAEWGE